MEDQLIQLRYWNLYREAIEKYVKAVEENENGLTIHALAHIVRIRERDLDQMEGK
jgi:hypothetical protein